MALKDAPRCTAKAKRSGKQCELPAVSGSKKCRMHGGSTPKGIESPHFKTGKHSKYLPARLSAIYEDIENDLEANILSRNIHLREALIRERLQWLEDSPDSAQVWSELRTLIDDIHIAYGGMNDAKMTLTLEKINRLLDERNLYHMTVAEIRKDLNEQRSDTNAKAAITAKSSEMITAPELMAFVGALFASIAQIVSNPKEIQEIHNAAHRLISAGESRSSELSSVGASIESD